MANEITVTAALEYLNGSIAGDMKALALTFDATRAGFVHNVQAFSTTSVAINQAAQTTEGFFMAINRDATISIYIGTNSTELVELRPGEPCLFRVRAGGPLNARAASGNVELEYILLED